MPIITARVVSKTQKAVMRQDQEVRIPMISTVIATQAGLVPFMVGAIRKKTFHPQYVCLKDTKYLSAYRTNSSERDCFLRTSIINFVIS